MNIKNIIAYKIEGTVIKTKIGYPQINTPNSFYKARNKLVNSLENIWKKFTCECLQCAQSEPIL